MAENYFSLPLSLLLAVAVSPLSPEAAPKTACVANATSSSHYPPVTGVAVIV